MVVCYVRLYASLAPNASPASRIYALLLPSADTTTWTELDVRQSSLGGFGTYPKRQAGLDWSDLSNTPVLMPYLGVETVTKDAHSLKLLLLVLKGEFERLTLGEVHKRHGERVFVADGLFAVPQREAHGSSLARSAPLPPSTPLLQVADGVAACYLLADDVRRGTSASLDRAYHWLWLLRSLPRLRRSLPTRQRFGSRLYSPQPDRRALIPL